MAKKQKPKAGTTTEHKHRHFVVPSVLENVPDILDTEVGKQAFKDLRKPIKAAGNALVQPVTTAGMVANDLLTGSRFFTAPIAQLGRFMARIMDDLEGCVEKVPPERRVDSPPEIAGPLLMHMRFMQENNPLREMFLKLLTASIDRDQQANLHPAFVQILPQLSPDEAKLFSAIQQHDHLQRDHIGWPKGPLQDFVMIHMTDDARPISSKILKPTIPLLNPDHAEMYLDRLISFTLVGKYDYGSRQIYYLTTFGQLFAYVVGIGSDS